MHSTAISFFLTIQHTILSFKDLEPDFFLNIVEKDENAGTTSRLWECWRGGGLGGKEE